MQPHLAKKNRAGHAKRFPGWHSVLRTDAWRFTFAFFSIDGQGYSFLTLPERKVIAISVINSGMQRVYVLMNTSTTLSTGTSTRSLSGAEGQDIGLSDAPCSYTQLILDISRLISNGYDQ